MMITIQSILNVADNSGAFKVICIKILGKKNHLHLLVIY